MDEWNMSILYNWITFIYGHVDLNNVHLLLIYFRKMNKYLWHLHKWHIHCFLPAAIPCNRLFTVYSQYLLTLNSSPLVPHICVNDSGQHWFRYWLVAYSAPSHYLNRCWVIINWTLRNKLPWNFNQNTKRFILVNASEYIVCEITAILSRGR